MKKVRGIWLPDDDVYFEKGYAFKDDWTYQWPKVQIALKYVKKFETAVDVGAHCGLITKELVKKFETVHAFEALEDHIGCLKANAPTAKVHWCILGDKGGQRGMHRVSGQSAASWVVEDGIMVQNQLDDSVLSPDFLKIDCEGYELFVLKGAVETLKRSHPVIMVEQKPKNASKYGLGDTDAVTFLQEMGYTLKKELSGDYILAWEV